MSTKWMLVLLASILAGCNSQNNVLPTPLSTFTPPAISTTETPQATIVPQVTLLPTPESLTNAALVRIFPLRRGAQWVYQQLAYDTLPNDLLSQFTDRQITATLLITDTVSETQTHGPYYAAQVTRERSIITTTLDLDLLGDMQEHYFGGNEPTTRWYIFADNVVYSQFEPLNWEQVDTSMLDYQLPLAEGARWYPDSEQRRTLSVNDPNPIPGLRLVYRAKALDIPLARDRECYQIVDVYNGGYPIHWFCLGLGIVADQFDHAGTPFGSRTELRQFVTGQ